MSVAPLCRLVIVIKRPHTARAIMSHKAFTGGSMIGNRRAAMCQPGVPQEDIALAWQKSRQFTSMGFGLLMYPRIPMLQLILSIALFVVVLEAVTE